MASFDSVAEDARQIGAFGQSAAASFLGSRSPRPSDTPENTVHRRQAKVTAVSTNSASVTIDLGSTIIPGVKFLDWYKPKVGDVVFVEFAGADPLVIGTISTITGARARVFRSSNSFNLPTNVISLVTFDAKAYDPNNNYNTGTGQYTVPLTGLYDITSQILIGGAWASNRGIIFIYVNGVLKNWGNDLSTAGPQPPGLVLATSLILTAGDLVDIRVFSNAVGSFVDGVGTGPVSYFNIRYIQNA